MANINWKAIAAGFSSASAKITMAQTISAVIAISAFGAAIFFWAATLDGVPAVGYFRLGITMAVAGAVIVWVIRLHRRCQQQAAALRQIAARLDLVEADHELLLDDVHIRKVLKRMRAQGQLPLVVAEDN